MPAAFLLLSASNMLQIGHFEWLFGEMIAYLQSNVENMQLMITPADGSSYH